MNGGRIISWRRGGIALRRRDRAPRRRRLAAVWNTLEAADRVVATVDEA